MGYRYWAMGYIPAKRDLYIRPVIFCREGQCLNEAKELLINTVH